MKQTGAQLVVNCLESLGVKRIFGIPGAKIDAVFNALVDSSIELIVCRHEQNAAFMAAAYGRLTGEPGVVLVTSGPGVSNLATGLLTATTEGDPVIALGGNVSREMTLRESHQNTDNVALLSAATKHAVEAKMVDTLPELIANAYRIAMEPRAGATFISLPQDILSLSTTQSPIEHLQTIRYACAPDSTILTATHIIKEAKCPILFLGQEASRPENTEAVRTFLKKNRLPTIATFQASGVVSHELVDCFLGRVGLFKNQPGDRLLVMADVVICVGFNAVEYDPETWNPDCDKKIIHIDYRPATLRDDYQPAQELLGDIKATLLKLNDVLSIELPKNIQEKTQRLHHELMESIASGIEKNKFPIHPLQFIWQLRQAIDDDALVICDIGTIYMWMARYFLAYQPHHLLFSNGQQTLGVALPWAISAALAFPERRIISMSGDGGFLFSAMELETAVREKASFTHFVWRDNAYNMVLEQEMLKYKRKSGVDFGSVDLVDFAKAFGAKGYRVEQVSDLIELFQQKTRPEGPVLVEVPIDYSDNPSLFLNVNEHSVK